MLGPGVIKAYEAGVLQPPPDRLAALAELYDVAPDDLRRRCARDVDVDMQDYVDAVISHIPPMTEAEIRAAAGVLRRIDQRRRAVRSARSPAGDAGRTNDRSEFLGDTDVTPAPMVPAMSGHGETKGGSR